MNSRDPRDVLQGRTIYWCPGGGGHLPYCPGPIDADDHIYCCTWYSETGDIPSCCRYPFGTGKTATLYIAAFVGVLCQESEDFLLRQKSLKRITLDGAWPESFLPQLEELVLGSENITLQTTNTNGIPFKYDFVKKVIKKNIEDPTCFLSLNGKISFEFKRLLCDHDLVTGKRISRKALCIEWQVSNEWILRAGIEIASNFHLRHFYNYPE
ncbi:hypothetical protein QR680_015255 [Steinernema hermaphroditum]|uniref:Uncharacterized protein n=1 Tax=Steinernema hermaphroditum TaxID=289476 RepID=A0AA39LKE4_9BILA|nr:hypothetical protein QR680_015255 [Steinernema hermaphroditum]